MNDLDFIKNKCLFIVDYLEELIPNFDIIIKEMRKGINKAYSKKNLKSLRICERDLKEWANGLDKSQKDELEKRLEENNLDSNFINIDDLIKIGKINTEEEYRALLIEKEEVLAGSEYKSVKQKKEINITHDDQSKINAINKMLISWENEQN